MIIVIDIGNTNIKTGMYEGDIMVDKAVFNYFKNIRQSDFEKIFEAFLSKKNITNCLIASVVDEFTEKVSNAIANVCKVKPLIIDTDLNLGINIKAKHPERFGIDRILNATAAVKQYPLPLIVIDSGTATTFDIVNSDGDFIGGVILPGISTQIKSLSDSTSKLPEINLSEMDKVQNTINTDSVKAILAGTVKGHAFALEGLIRDCEKELHKKPVIIGTGGNAEFISKYMKNNIFDYINPSLTIEGMKIVYDLNKD